MTVKDDFAQGCVLFRATEAADIIGQNYFNFDDEPELDFWAFRVLDELSNDPAPLGPYARAVKQALLVKLSDEAPARCVRH